MINLKRINDRNECYSATERYLLENENVTRIYPRLGRVVVFVSLSLLILCANGFSSRPVPAFVANSVIGYQQGFGFSTPVIRPAFDLNICHLFRNGGFNYEKHYGPSVFFGGGLGSLIQLQYGNGFSISNHIIRLRSDLPLGDFHKSDRHGTDFSLLDYASLGLFCDCRFNSASKFTIGVSISASLFYPFVQWGVIK